MKNDITIVIPVYNVEKYISRCLDSLINQTYKNFDIILIDDGSKDKSLNICKDYAKKYKNIKVYPQKNTGPAIARNNGIKKVKTPYLMFVDSDDYVDVDYVETYYKSIVNTNYDVVMGGYRKTNGKNIHFERKLNCGEFAKYIVTGPYAKIYKTDFIQKNKIEFLDTNSSEDVYFSLKIINMNAKIKTISYVGYNYFDNLFSISNTSHKGFKQDIKILELLDEINYNEGPNINLNQYYIIRYCIWYLLYSGKTAKKTDFIFEYNKLFYWLSENIPNYKNNKYIKINGPKGEINKIGNIIFIFMLLHRLRLVPLFSRIYCIGDKNE